MRYDPQLNPAQASNQIIVFQKVSQNQATDQIELQELSWREVSAQRRKSQNSKDKKSPMDNLIMKKKIVLIGIAVLVVMIGALLGAVVGKRMTQPSPISQENGRNDRNQIKTQNELNKQKITYDAQKSSQQSSQSVMVSEEMEYQVPPSKSSKTRQKKIKQLNAVYVDLQHSPSSTHKHSQTFTYPTVGIPIVGKTFNDTLVSKSNLATFDAEINQMLKPYNDTNCQYARYGDGTYTGTVMCSNFLDGAEALINVGISGVDDFGCQIATKHHILNYQYDCINPRGPVCISSNDLTSFLNICMGSVTEKTAKHIFYTYQDVLKSHQLQGKRVILKMNNQGGQYEGLKFVPIKLLDKIDMIVLQLHFQSIHPEEWGLLDIVNTLSSKFVSVNYHFNNWSCFKGEEANWRRIKSKAVEVTLINKKLITLKSESRSFHSHPLNERARKDWDDCQMEG